MQLVKHFFDLLTPWVIVLFELIAVAWFYCRLEWLISMLRTANYSLCFRLSPVRQRHPSNGTKHLFLDHGVLFHVLTLHRTGCTSCTKTQLVLPHNQGWRLKELHLFSIYLWWGYQDTWGSQICIRFWDRRPSDNSNGQNLLDGWLPSYQFSLFQSSWYIFWWRRALEALDSTIGR